MAGNVILSARMQAVADMAEKGNRVCDVGCDHGYVPIYLVQRGIAPKVLAMDINKGPLRRAMEHVEQAGLSEYITLRLSDGLLSYACGEADTLICAGMGGRLMQKILEREPEKTDSFREMILQPQSEIADFRKFLRNKGYSICQEDMIWEGDKFYPIIKAVPGKHRELPEQDSMEIALADRFGPVLLSKRHPVLLAYLQREWENNICLKEKLKEAEESARAKRRLLEIEEELFYLREALRLCGREP